MNEIIRNADVVNGATKSFLTFQLEEEQFAINVEKVIEILEVPKITKVPKAPDFMKGVINLRGSVLPVIDTRIKFNLPLIEQTVDTCIIVLNAEIEGDSVYVGILVDAVQEVLEVEEDQIQPSPTIGSKYKSEVIQGMIKNNEQFIMLLNIEKVFTSSDLVSLKETDDKPDIDKKSKKQKASHTEGGHLTPPESEVKDKNK